MIKSIFFDFNGVIIDDETIQMTAYKEVLKQYDIDLTEEWYFSALGMDDRTFVKAMFERAKKPMADGVLESVLGAKTILHRKMIEDELPLFPGVLTFLKACSRHFSLGLVSMRLANADVLPFDYTDYANQLQQFFNEAMKFAKEYKLDSSFDEKAMNNAIEEFGKAAERAERIQQRASSQTGDKAKLANINDTLIAVEREFTDERGLRGRSWYKHQIYAPGIYTGYAAQPLTDFRQSIDDRNSTNTRESLQRIVEAIKRATERLREIHD